MPSESAISLFRRPRRTSASTSSSREVNSEETVDGSPRRASVVFGRLMQVRVEVRAEQSPQQGAAGLPLTHQRPDVVHLAREAQELDQPRESSLLVSSPVGNGD